MHISSSFNPRLLKTSCRRILMPVWLFLLLGTSLVVQAGVPAGGSDDPVANRTLEQKEARMAEMKERVREIKAMDKSHLSRTERRALRAELRSMNKEAHRMGYGGVYISVGALIIIILLLIIILH